MTDRELMQQALDALEDACGGRCNAENNPCWQRSVANALRERLAQPEQEPVAWMSIGVIVKSEIPQFYTGPLYLTSSLSSLRPWIGLTDGELAEFSDAKLGSYDLCLEVEAYLQSKNT